MMDDFCMNEPYTCMMFAARRQLMRMHTEMILACLEKCILCARNHKKIHIPIAIISLSDSFT